MLKAQAYRQFKARLFDGKLRPGQFISQRELAETMGMPIAPVRDALKQLQAESLVRVIPQRGVQITDVNLRLVREAFELRGTLEIHAARCYAERGDLARLVPHETQMRAIRERAESAFSEELARAFLRADLAFHRTLVDALDNELIAEVYRVNADRLLLAQLMNRLDPRRLAEAVDEHLAIVDALRRRDADGAAAGMARHLAAAQRKMMGVG